MAQLVERSPPTQEIRGSTPVIGKLISINCLLLNVNKEKVSGNGLFLTLLCCFARTFSFVTVRKVFKDFAVSSEKGYATTYLKNRCKSQIRKCKKGKNNVQKIIIKVIKMDGYIRK